MGASAVGQAGFEPRHILVVDDDPSVRHMISSALSTSGFVVTQAQNGAQGLGCVQRLRPDLVISDVQMPEMDGVTLCRELKTDPATSSIPVILISGASKDLADRASAAGAEAALAKPFSVLHLIRVVQALLPALVACTTAARS